MRFFTKLSLFLLLFTFSFSLQAQRNVSELVESKRPQLENLPEVALARAIPGNPAGLDLKEIKQYQLFSIDRATMNNRKNTDRGLLKLKLDYGNRPMVLELVKKDLFGPQGKVTLASNGNAIEMTEGDYYWGKVRGKANSMAAISIFEDNIEGLITIDGENFNFGKLKDEPYHIMYRSNDVPFDQPECLAESLVEDIGNTTTGSSIPETGSSAIGSVGIYYEIDHDIYLAKNSSITETTNFITAILNEVAIIYANESINLYISELKVWDVVDPYAGLSGAGARLDAFRDNLNGNYNGDLAHLISFDGGGGLAYINVLCNDFYGVGYSSINNSYNTFPTYSWTVMVLAHEIGHNLGSPHTHSCAWNGNNTPLDGCGIDAGYGDSNCTGTGPIPANGGTVMSYCHLLSVGINLSEGFGAQPGDLIRSKIVNAANTGCLIGCVAGSTCDDGNDCTSNDAYDANCNCVGTALPDSDNDGVCDANDICPGGDDSMDTDGDGTPDACDTCNDNLIGTACDDGNVCTTNDVYDANCNCTGVSADSDNDGVCDANDICPGGNDSVDTDGDGTPDFCDTCDDNLVGTACDDGSACTTNDVYDANCNCAGVATDGDNDGVCDSDDICPGGDDNIDTDGDGIPDFCDTCNDNLAGTACDDGDDCTTGDVYDANCNCAGVSADSDNDGICDAVDICPGGDDLLDANGNGLPDACEVTCVNQTTNFSISSLTHLGSGAATTTLTFTESTKDVQFTIAEINSKLNGKTNRRYTEQVMVTYIDGSGNNKTYGVYSGQNTTSANININEIVQSVTISLKDIYSGNTTTQMSVSISTVAICAEPCQDDDNDGVCNAADACPGFDDTLDADGDGVPDGCDNCNNVTSTFQSNTLVNTGTGSTSTILNLNNQTDITFTISQLGARTGGKPNNRYIDEVTISYIDGNGVTHTYGTFSGQNQSSVAVNIAGTVSQLSVSLTNGYAGGTANISVNLSAVSACQIGGASLGQATTRNTLPELNFEAYPNPFSESIQINLINTEKGGIKVIDYYGRVIHEIKLVGEGVIRKTLDTSNWPGGLYYVEYHTGKRFRVQKIIKARL